MHNRPLSGLAVQHEALLSASSDLLPFSEPIGIGHAQPRVRFDTSHDEYR